MQEETRPCSLLLHYEDRAGCGGGVEGEGGAGRMEKGKVGAMGGERLGGLGGEGGESGA